MIYKEINCCNHLGKDLTCTLAMLSRFQRGKNKRFAKRSTSCKYDNMRNSCIYKAYTVHCGSHILPSFGQALFPNSGQFYRVVLLQTAAQVQHSVPLQSPNPFQRAFQQ